MVEIVATMENNTTRKLMSNKKQTAVEWLAEYLTNKGYINAPTFTHKLIDEAINQAKEMEKKQMKDALHYFGIENAEQYYNETYGKKD
jgi:hypothetical protein